MFSRRESIIGIDLSHAFLTAVVLERHSRKDLVSAEDFAVLNLEKGRPLDESLQILLKSLKTQCRDCAVALWPKDAVIKFIDHAAPLGSVQELLKRNSREILQEEFTDFVFGSSQVTTATLETINRSPKKYVCCGMPRGEFSNVDASFTKAKLRIKVLQLSPLAIFNAFDTSQPDIAKRASYLVADIGQTLTTIIGGHCGELRFARSLQWGLNDLIEMLILEGGIAPGEDLRAIADDDIINLEAIRRGISDIAHEIVASLNYFQTDGERPDCVYFSGTANSHDSFKKILKEEVCARMLPVESTREVDVSFEPWNPLQRIHCAKKLIAGDIMQNEHANLPAAAGAAFQYLY